MRQSNSRQGGVKATLQKNDSTFLFDNFLNNHSPPSKFARPAIPPKRQEAQLAQKISNFMKGQQKQTKVNLTRGRKLVSTSVNLTTSGDAGHNTSVGAYLTQSESS